MKKSVLIIRKWEVGSGKWVGRAIWKSIVLLWDFPVDRETLKPQPYFPFPSSHSPHNKEVPPCLT